MKVVLCTIFVVITLNLIRKITLNMLCLPRDIFLDIIPLYKIPFDDGVKAVLYL